MFRTIIILLGTLIALPIAAFYSDQPLTPEHSLALQILIRLMIGIAVTCFIVSELTQNYSQVDKLWSIMPLVYVWVGAGQ